MQNPNCFDEAYLTNGRWPGPTLAEIERMRQHPERHQLDAAGDKERQCRHDPGRACTNDKPARLDGRR